jgi:hypothetical protein
MTTSLPLDRKVFAGLTAAVAAIALFLIAAPGAKAGVLVESAPDCAEENLTKPFLPWADVMDYQFAPDGGFEAGGDGWALDGAAAASGNETNYVHDAGDSSSLAMPAGSTATSPTICVGLEHPTLRFFAKKTSGLLASMAVEVRFELSTGAVVSAPVGVVTPSSSWQPTLPMPVVANLLPLLPGDHTPVQFKFTALSGNWKIDDVYVDPTRRN